MVPDIKVHLALSGRDVRAPLDAFWLQHEETFFEPLFCSSSRADAFNDHFPTQSVPQVQVALTRPPCSSLPRYLPSEHVLDDSSFGLSGLIADRPSLLCQDLASRRTPAASLLRPAWPELVSKPYTRRSLPGSAFLQLYVVDCISLCSLTIHLARDGYDTSHELAYATAFWHA